MPPMGMGGSAIAILRAAATGRGFWGAPPSPLRERRGVMGRGTVCPPPPSLSDGGHGPLSILIVGRGHPRRGPLGKGEGGQTGT